jgi:hypothetical protein
MGREIGAIFVLGKSLLSAASNRRKTEIKMKIKTT